MAGLLEGAQAGLVFADGVGVVDGRVVGLQADEDGVVGVEGGVGGEGAGDVRVVVDALVHVADGDVLVRVPDVVEAVGGARAFGAFMDDGVDVVVDGGEEGGEGGGEAGGVRGVAFDDGVVEVVEHVCREEAAGGAGVEGGGRGGGGEGEGLVGRWLGGGGV